MTDRQDDSGALRERQIAEFQRMRDEAALAIFHLPQQLESAVRWKINCFDAAIAALQSQQDGAQGDTP